MVTKQLNTMNNLEENYKKILEVLRELDKKENYRKQIRKPKMTDKEIIPPLPQASTLVVK